VLLEPVPVEVVAPTPTPKTVVVVVLVEERREAREPRVLVEEVTEVVEALPLLVAPVEQEQLDRMVRRVK
jgi:hypothetical protein